MNIRKLVRLACVFSTVCCQTGCHASCPVGFMPPDCQEQCKSGLFGLNCASVCPATCTGRECRPDTGFCYRCHDGFTGPKCSLKCRSGFFGQDCKISCPVNCLKSVCDPFTGLCERCLKGYAGVKCERRSVLWNSSVQSGIDDDSDVGDVTRKTSRSIVVYILVVLVSCLLPVCAVAVCVYCARKHSSREVELGAKPMTASHIPVLTTNPRRPGRLALKYEQMQTIEEESSNQFTLEDDVHDGAALNPPAASANSLHTHEGFYTPSQRHTSQATTLDPTTHAPGPDSPYNHQQQYLFNDDRDPSFDFSQTTKGIQRFGVGDVYTSQDMCITQQSNPTTNFGSDVVTNTVSTDLRIHMSAQAACPQNEESLYDRRGSVLSVSSETPRRAPCLARAGTHTKFQLETAGSVSPTVAAAEHVGHAGYINPQITVETLRSECSSSFQEYVPAREYTHNPAPTELSWQQAQAIRQADNPHGDMVALDSPSDMDETNQDKTAGQAGTVPRVGHKIPGYPDPTQSVSQQFHHPDPTQSVSQQFHHPDPTQSVSQQFHHPDPTQSVSQQFHHPDPTQSVSQQFHHPDPTQSVCQQFHHPDPTQSVCQQFHHPDPTQSVCQQFHHPDPTQSVCQQFHHLDPTQSVSQQFHHPDPTQSVSQQFHHPDPTQSVSQQFHHPDPTQSVSQQFHHPDPTQPVCQQFHHLDPTQSVCQQFHHLDPTQSVCQQIHHPDPTQSVSQQFHHLDPTQSVCQQIHTDPTQSVCQQIHTDPTQSVCQQFHHLDPTQSVCQQFHHLDPTQSVSQQFHTDPTQPVCQQIHTEPTQSVYQQIHTDPTQSVCQQIHTEPTQSVCQQIHTEPTQSVCQQIHTEPTQSVCQQIHTEPTQSVCQQIHHSNNTDVGKVDTFPEFQKSKMASVALETRTPYVVQEMYRSNDYRENLHSESADSLSEWQAPRTLPLFTLECHNMSEVSQPQKPETSGVAPVCTGDRNRTATDQYKYCRELNQDKRSHVDRAEVQQKDNLVGSSETEQGYSPGSAARLVNLGSANRHIQTAASTAVSIPASTAGSNTPSVTAVLHRCQVRGEEEMLVGGDAVDTTCRHVHTVAYTQMTVRHSFDCATDGCDVFRDSSSLDFAAEERNEQTRQVMDGHTDQTSGDVCKQTGQLISSSTDTVPSTRSFPVDGSANNINRLNALTRQPPSSSTTTSSRPVHKVQQTSCLHLGRNEPRKKSAVTETFMSEASIPLFSISSSAPMKLSVTYCKNALDEEKPACMHPAPRYFSMSSLGNMDQCPARNCDPLELSVQLASPPKDSGKKCSKGKDSGECRHNPPNQIFPESVRPGTSHQLTSPPKDSQKKCSKGKDSGECRHNPPNQIVLESGRPVISQPRKPSAIKCDQFRQVVYTEETPCRHKTTPQCHLSVGADSKILTGKCRKCKAMCSQGHQKPANRSDASNSTCSFDPISLALDENPIRHNLVPETRNFESLTPVSAIKMYWRQRLDREILKLHTSDKGAGVLPPTVDQENPQERLASMVRPLTEYTETASSRNRDILQCEPHQDIPNSCWSENSHFPLVLELTHDGNVRSRRSDEVSRTGGVPMSTPPQAGALLVENTTNLGQVMVSNMSFSTPSDATRQSTGPDNRPGIEPSNTACKPPVTVIGYYPQLWVLGSRQHRSSTAAMDSMYPVDSDDSFVATFPASDRSKASSPTTSAQGLNTGGHQIVAEILPTQVTVPGNHAVTEERHQSGTLGHSLPPNTYKPNIYPSNMYPSNTYPSNTTGEQNSTRRDKYAHKTRSRISLQQKLEPAGQEPVVIYPLPSLLEELAIWERTVPAAVTNTEACLLPAEHSDVVVAQSAMGRQQKKTTDTGSGPSGCQECSEACSQESGLRCQFNNKADSRPKLNSTMCFSDHKKAGSDCSSIVDLKRVPHIYFDNVGNSHRLSNCCQSKAGNELSQEKRQCCRKDSSEFISVSEEVSDVFFDALDSVPAAGHARPGYNQQDHTGGMPSPARYRKRAVKFVETSAMQMSDVDFSGNKSTERHCTREWKDNKKVCEERLQRSLRREKRRQQNIAFRFAAPSPTDSTIDAFQDSVSKIPDQKRQHKHLPPAEGKDLVGNLPPDSHGQIVPNKVSVCGQTKAWTFTKTSHSGSNTGRSLVGAEGADSVHYRSESSDRNCCSVKDQHSAAEDFYSIQEN